jgi:hypothetical protein
MEAGETLRHPMDGSSRGGPRIGKDSMIALIDDEATWPCMKKADRLLGVLSTREIALLGDAFPWTVTDDDVAVARTHLLGARVAAIEVGRRIARLAADEDAATRSSPLGDTA